MKKLYILLALVALCWIGLPAQVVTTQPAVVQTDSHDIIITFHADRGNKGLMGVGKNTKVYAHTGVITNKSTSSSDWKYAPKWGDNSPKYELTWVSANTWTLTIPDINTYYGVPAGETVKQLAFVFRTADNSKEGKAEGGKDIFVNVLPAGFQLELTSDLPSEVLTWERTGTFTVVCSRKADITLSTSTSQTPFAEAHNATTLTGSHTFVDPGETEIIAKAVADGQTVTKSLKFTRLVGGEYAPYPGGEIKMGAVTNPDGSVTFCIAAPEKESMLLVGSWNNYAIDNNSLMSYDEDEEGNYYFWQTVKGLQAGKDYIYFYMVDGEKAVGDPYANLVLDPWNDRYITSSVYPNMPKYPSNVVSDTPVAVYNSTMNDYNWQIKDFHGPAQSDLIVYELLIRDFTGTEGKANGNGTVAGVIDKLDYLKSLGVNAIELLPIMEFNGNLSWGYNTNFYFAPDKAYGTPDDYRRLVDEAHARGMAVILDIVFNQSDGLHPWYMMYPIDHNPFYNGSAPHGYSVLNDWNQDNSLVQRQWHDALKYWITEYNVDGYRFDLVKGLGDNYSYDATYNPSTNTWSNVSDAKTNAFNHSRIDRMKALHNAIREVKPDAYFINENLAGAQEENEMAKDGEINWANINNASCQFAMGYSSDSNLSRFYAPSDSRTWGSTVSYAESHDEERMAYKQNKWGAAGVKGNVATSMRRLGSVAAQMLMTPGAHMIWQFQEFGADQTTKNSDGGNNTDNKTVIWNYLNDADRNGLMQSYRELCWLRRDNPQLFKQGVNTSVNSSSWDGRSISLVSGKSAIYTFVNPSVSDQVTIASGVNLSGAGYKLLSCSYGTTPRATASGVELAPGAYAVYGTTDIAGIGTEAVAGTERVLIYGIEGAIVVEGDCDDVQAYTIAGTTVPPSGLEPGIYIVRAGTQTAKVVVY